MKKPLYYLSMITISLALGLMVYFMFLAFYPYRVFEVQDVDMITTTLRPGETLRYRLTYCKYINKPSITSRSLINDVVLAMPIITSNNPPGCGSKIVESTVIPLEVRPGFYKLSVNNAYQVNLIRIIDVSYETPTFEVIK